MFNNIISYNILIEYEPEIIIVEDVTFNKAFSPWRQGERCDCIEIDYTRSTIKETNKAGEIIKQTKFIIIPEES